VFGEVIDIPLAQLFREAYHYRGGALALPEGTPLCNEGGFRQNGVYSVISPESCAAIVWRDASQAALAAEALKLTAPDLLELGMVDEIVEEPGEGAHTDWDEAARLLGDAIERNLAALDGVEGASLREARYQTFRAIGSFFSE
jgi:acetyl-CoA carboxylase carboxyl transferase subunit alpha